MLGFPQYFHPQRSICVMLSHHVWEVASSQVNTRRFRFYVAEFTDHNRFAICKTPKRRNPNFGNPKMPPKRRVSAPTNRVYKSSTPLHQTRLPVSKKRVKSYGKKNSVRIPKQDTLTQMDFVRIQQHEDQEEEDIDEYVDQAEKRKSKRRKTMGDEPSSTSELHTQTLTQWERSFTSEKDEDDSIFNVPSSSQSMKLPGKSRKRSKAKSSVENGPNSEKSPTQEMPPPHTPRRVFEKEIPSSQSPATPLSLQSRGSVGRGSPLKEMTNVPIPFNSNPGRQGRTQKLPELGIEETVDTDASQLNPIPSTPSKRSSPTKSVRFAIPAVDDNGEEEIGTASPSIKKESTPFPTSQVALLDVDEQDEAEVAVASPLMKTESTPIRTTQASIGQSVKIEIGDSDEGSEEEMEEGEPDETTSAEAAEETHAETCYGEFGAETQIEAERLFESPIPSGAVVTTQIEEDVTEEAVEEKTQGMTQGMESQRLSARHVNAMAPRTIDSDIFISIHPQHVTNIVNRKKNHEFRNWDFKESVVRIWVYETFPVQTLKYMAEVGPAKRPGEIKDERGLGNAEFNAKIGPAYRAYEILRLYELADPIPLSKLKSNEWFKAPPQKFSWVRPAVLGELMGNLKPPLYDNTEESEESIESSRDTQEAEAQLLSNIHQFTHPAPHSDHPSSPVLGAKTESDEPVASVQKKTPRNASKFPPPSSQATTVDLSQTQTPGHQSVVEIIWESPTRPIPSSTPMKLPTPRSDGPEHHGPESLAPFSMASSQLLTKSQMLSDGLLHDSIPGPPPIIMDSDEEDD
jgi:hypothetical protein